MEKLLEIKNLNTWFYSQDGIIKAVRDVNFSLNKGEILGIVGESGCGKSVMAKSIIGLVEKPGKIVSGKIMFEGRELQDLEDNKMRKIRGKDIAYLLQNPMSAFNPMFTVIKHIRDSILIHEKVKKEEANRRAIDLLRKTGISNSEKVGAKYPHQFSGGMLQRGAIAMAIACTPKLLIADEPTTALDVSLQSQILQLLKSSRDEYNMSIILITHNFGVVWDICDRVIVMYGGQIVELASVNEIYENPIHPYTKALLDSMVTMGIEKDRILPSLKGGVIDLSDISGGCDFAPRCLYATDYCRNNAPILEEIDKNHFVKCHYTNKRN